MATGKSPDGSSTNVTLKKIDKSNIVVLYGRHRYFL